MVMRRSLVILAVTAVCGGGSVAVATAAYANGNSGGDDRSEGSSRTLPGWLAGLDGSAADDESGTTSCRLPRGLPELGKLPRLRALPKLFELPELLYSEQAVKDRDTGEVEHQVTQLGRITDRTDEALTVESSDGTAWAWAVTEDTTVYAGGRDASVSSLDVGDRVLVHGTRDGDTRQADHIGDPAPGPPARLPDQLLRCHQDEKGTGTAA
jgi:hypothetical protein